MPARKDQRAALSPLLDAFFEGLGAKAVDVLSANLDRAGKLVPVDITAADYERMAELVELYDDWPLGGTDASVIAVAERLEVTTVATLDHRHFGPIQPRHVDAFTLLPETL